MKLFLAPMEGVVDWVVRDIYSEIGGIDQFTTEFIRITDSLLPNKVFLRNMPELLTQSRTRSGTAVFAQLLGSDPSAMADNAAALATLGCLGIDLNFGCPAKLVNRRDGGAVLLKTPDRVYAIVNAVRKSVPSLVPVTAKIRLGFDDPSQCLENAQAVQSGGASQITVHARTKVDGYRPPAHWQWLPKIKEKIQIPVVANGEIWNVEDFHQARKVSQCEDVMIGRGAIANPFIFRQIRESVFTKNNPSRCSQSSEDRQSWPEIQKLLPQFFAASSEFKSPYFAQARTKQWLRQLSLQHESAKALFDELKLIMKPKLFQERLLGQ